MKTIKNLTAEELNLLTSHPWPGNIRELENTVQRLIISAKSDNISLMDVMKDSHGELFGTAPSMIMSEVSFDDKDDGQDREIDLEKAVEEYEKGLIKYACDKYGSTRKAAKALGISQTQIVRKKKKYEL